VLLAWLLHPSYVLANDSSFGGSAADLVPLKETRVRMVSEDIVATFDGEWKVSAAYVFENPTAQAVTLQMGFPEPRCPEDMDCHVSQAFKDLETTVRGVPVEHRKGSLSMSKLSEILGKVWLYDVSFAAKERVEIHHSYRVGGSYSIGGGYDLVYITRTGALWSGPIGSATFRFRCPAWMISLTYAKGSKPNDIHIVREGEEAYTEVVFEMHDWKPKKDLWVAFELDGMDAQWKVPAHPVPGIDPCPLQSDDLFFTAQQAVDDGAAAVDALARTWNQQPPLALRTCANNVFARYGRKFDSELYNRFFYGAKGWAPGAPPYKPYAPNPAYSTALLGAHDWAVLKVLRAAKALRAGPERNDQKRDSSR
jgi:hypothetical protein